MSKKSYLIRIDTDCDLDLTTLKERFGDRLCRTNYGCYIYIITDDKYKTISDLDELLHNTKLEGLIEHFNRHGWSQDESIDYSNYILSIYNYDKTFQDLKKDFEGFRNIIKEF